MSFMDWVRGLFPGSEVVDKPTELEEEDNGRPQGQVFPAPEEEEEYAECKCIHCHQEFDFEDYLGLCTSRSCYSVNVFYMDIQQGIFNPELGPRQILLRPQTRHRVKEEYPIEDMLEGKRHICPQCHSRIYFYACPHCRHPMPRIGREVFDNMIAPAGIGGSGKSVYMTVLINELMLHPINMPRTRVNSRFLAIEDLHRYEKKHEMLYTDKERLPSNYGDEIPAPYLLQTTTTLNQGAKGEKSNTYTLWYDFAGELYEMSTGQHYGHRYYASVKGILLFVDPTNSEDVIKQMGLRQNPVDNVESANSLRDIKVLNQIENAVEKMGDRGDIKNTFIAVIVNKIDLFRGKDFPFFREGSPVWDHSPHQREGAFSLYDYKLVEEEVINYLKVYHSGVFDYIGNWANDDHSNIGYFGVSALGNPLVGDRIVHDIRPIRVTDPFYWLLWKLGNFPALGNDGAE